MGKMDLAILASVAEAERQRIMERTNEGRTEAEPKGIKFELKFRIDRRKVSKMKKDGRSAVEIANALNIGRSTLYRFYLNRTFEQTSH